jgi:adenylate kinase
LSIKHIFIFIGPPGSGKGTLSQNCVKRLGWYQLSTGDLCRKHIKEQTEIGKHIDFAIKSGKLIDDALIVQMVKESLENHSETVEAVILDGFPRTEPQAKALQQLLKDSFSGCRLWVVVFDIADEIVIKRLSARIVCSNLSCQSVYTLNNSSLASRKDGICDACGGLLVQRSDDQADAISQRLVVYHEHEQRVLNFYKNSGSNVVHLKAYKPLDSVYDEFIAYVFAKQ